MTRHQAHLKALITIYHLIYLDLQVEYVFMFKYSDK
jgi:hypothetical protein